MKYQEYARDIHKCLVAQLGDERAWSVKKIANRLSCKEKEQRELIEERMKLTYRGRVLALIEWYYGEDLPEREDLTPEMVVDIAILKTAALDRTANVKVILETLKQSNPILFAGIGLDMWVL